MFPVAPEGPQLGSLRPRSCRQPISERMCPQKIGWEQDRLRLMDSRFLVCGQGSPISPRSWPGVGTVCTQSTPSRRSITQGQ